VLGDAWIYWQLQATVACFVYSFALARFAQEARSQRPAPAREGLRGRPRRHAAIDDDLPPGMTSFTPPVRSDEIGQTSCRPSLEAAAEAVGDRSLKRLGDLVARIAPTGR